MSLNEPKANLGEKGEGALDHPDHADPSSTRDDGWSQVSSPPLAVVAKIKSALRIVALDESAERLGLTRGQALADARAMIPALGVADDDPDADIALLELVADWAERYTPLVALTPATMA